jgi:hypothetical protein
MKRRQIRGSFDLEKWLATGRLESCVLPRKAEFLDPDPGCSATGELVGRLEPGLLELGAKLGQQPGTEAGPRQLHYLDIVEFAQLFFGDLKNNRRHVSADAFGRYHVEQLRFEAFLAPNLSDKSSAGRPSLFVEDIPNVPIIESEFEMVAEESDEVLAAQVFMPIDATVVVDQHGGWLGIGP